MISHHLPPAPRISNTFDNILRQTFWYHRVVVTGITRLQLTFPLCSPPHCHQHPGISSQPHVRSNQSFHISVILGRATINVCGVCPTSKTEQRSVHKHGCVCTRVVCTFVDKSTRPPRGPGFIALPPSLALLFFYSFFFFFPIPFPLTKSSTWTPRVFSYFSSSPFQCFIYFLLLFYSIFDIDNRNRLAEHVSSFLPANLRYRHSLSLSPLPSTSFPCNFKFYFYTHPSPSLACLYALLIAQHTITSSSSLTQDKALPEG